MRAINHAITGALIGLSVHEPLLAAPLAFASHLAQDAIPHHDQPLPELERLRSKFFKQLLIVDTCLCAALLVLLALTRPHNWMLAGFCAFLAASPDLFWIPKFIYAKHHHLLEHRNWFLRLHSWMQWRTGPRLAWVELGWFVIFGTLLVTKL